MAVLATVWHGGRQVVLPAFDPARALDLIEAERVTATLVVPTMMAAMSEEQLARPRDVSSLACSATAESPVATETLRRALPRSRCRADACLRDHRDGPARDRAAAGAASAGRTAGRSCGQPAVGVEVAVVDQDRMPMPTGEVGELAVRGENVMAGYWNKPEATAEALSDGWYRTGDLGHMDEHGFIYLVDRARDMIVSGGENVYSTEVEEALYRHQAVLEAAVFGIPDARWGEAVHAVVVPRAPVDEAELLSPLPRPYRRLQGAKTGRAAPGAAAEIGAPAKSSSASCARPTGRGMRRWSRAPDCSTDARIDPATSRRSIN